MAFGAGSGIPVADAGSVRGIQRNIACECWFTSTGKVIPRMLKIQDEDGEIRTIREITVHAQEKKRYAGVPSIEYDCTLVLHGRGVRAWLIYYQSENRWVINFRQTVPTSHVQNSAHPVLSGDVSATFGRENTELPHS